jgi:hypothetical protein
MAFRCVQAVAPVTVIVASAMATWTERRIAVQMSKDHADVPERFGLANSPDLVIELLLFIPGILALTRLVADRRPAAGSAALLIHCRACAQPPCWPSPLSR